MSRVIIWPCVQCGQCLTKCRCGGPAPSPERCPHDVLSAQECFECTPKPAAQADHVAVKVQADSASGFGDGGHEANVAARIVGKPAAPEEPREWTLHGADSGAKVNGLYNLIGPRLRDEVVDVIEKSALDRVVAERDEWRQEALRNIDWLHAEQDGTEKLRAELAECRRIKLGDTLCGKAIAERDEARAEVDRLKAKWEDEHQRRYRGSIDQRIRFANENNRLKVALERIGEINVMIGSENIRKVLREALERGEGE